MFGVATRRVLTFALAAAGLMAGASIIRTAQTRGKSQRGADRAPRVKGGVALATLMSLSDGHLQKMADSLQMLGMSDAARSADWEQIKDPLAEVAKRNVPALNWFALPDGSYWSVQHGKENANLATRAYFPKVLAGQTVIGDLVVSKATGMSMAIVAVPVVGQDRSVVGVLGASVYLDKLSALIEQEMALDDTMIFYSFDSAPLVALNWDPHLIFIEPKKAGEELSRAFDEMLSKEQGVVNYTFRGKERTVLFQKSPVTGWWYAFGIIPEGRETKQPLQEAR